MNATDAATMVAQFDNSSVINAELEKILAKVKEAARNGRCFVECEIPRKYESSLLTRLRALGFGTEGCYYVFDNCFILSWKRDTVPATTTQRQCIGCGATCSSTKCEYCGRSI